VYIPYVKSVSEKFKHKGIDITLGQSSNLNTLLRRPGQTESHNRWHGASIAFLVNMAEATLAKEADL
jgi:hypothetical protein